MVYVAKVLRKKLKKNLFAIVFVVSFYTRVCRCLLVRSLWSRSRSCGCAPALVLVVVACVPGVVVALVLVFLRSGSGCILHYFADLGKMGAHAYTRTRIHAQ